MSKSPPCSAMNNSEFLRIKQKMIRAGPNRYWGDDFDVRFYVASRVRNLQHKKVLDVQPDQIIELMKQMKIFSQNKVISILGLAFKKDTDDIREAVSEKLVRKLLNHGIKVRVYNPMAINNFKSLFGKRITYFDSVKDCLRDSDCCVLLTEWNAYKKLTPNNFKKMNKPNVIDARRVLVPEKFSAINFKAIGLGNEKIRKR